MPALAVLTTIESYYLYSQLEGQRSKSAMFKRRNVNGILIRMHVALVMLRSDNAW